MDVLKLISMAKELGERVKGAPSLLALLTRMILASAPVRKLSGHPFFEIIDGKIDGIALDDIESALKNAGLSCHHLLIHRYRRPSTAALFLDPKEEVKQRNSTLFLFRCFQSVRCISHRSKICIRRISSCFSFLKQNNHLVSLSI